MVHGAKVDLQDEVSCSCIIYDVWMFLCLSLIVLAVCLVARVRWMHGFVIVGDILRVHASCVYMPYTTMWVSWPGSTFGLMQVLPCPLPTSFVHGRVACTCLRSNACIYVDSHFFCSSFASLGWRLAPVRRFP